MKLSFKKKVLHQHHGAEFKSSCAELHSARTGFDLPISAIKLKKVLCGNHPTRGVPWVSGLPKNGDTLTPQYQDFVFLACVILAGMKQPYCPEISSHPDGSLWKISPKKRKRDLEGRMSAGI